MRHTILFLLLLTGPLLSAQVPQGFDFQGVARDAQGQLLASRPIALRIALHAGAPGGTVAYQETHSVTTGPFGLFNVQVGHGTPTQGSFPAVAWGASSIFIQVEMDATGGTTFIDMGTTQLLSVPYALHAKAVDCFSVSLQGDTLKQGNGCYVIIPGISAANGGCQDADGDGYYDQEGCGTLVDCDDHDPQVNPALGCTLGCTPQETAHLDLHQRYYLQTFINFWHRERFQGETGALTQIIQEWREAGHLPLAMECHLCTYAFLDCVPLYTCLSRCTQGAVPCAECYFEQTACMQAFIGCTGLTDADDDGWSAGSDCDDNDPSVHAGQGCDGHCSEVARQHIDGSLDRFLSDIFTAWANCDPDDPACQAGMIGSTFGMPISQDCQACALEYITCFGSDPVCGPICMDRTGHPISTCRTCIVDSPCRAGLLNCLGLVDADGDGWSAGSDCDDNDPAVGLPTRWYPDLDGDGYAGQANPVHSCTAPDGYFSEATDCNDNDPQVYPGATEFCNGMDDNCNGVVDDDAAWTTWYLDADGDGYGNSDSPVVDCVQPIGHVAQDGDCDDSDPDIHPGRPEMCNGIDDNCNGMVDDNACAPELCDGVDNDNDGLIDAADPSLVLVFCEMQQGVCQGTKKSPQHCVNGDWLPCGADDYSAHTGGLYSWTEICDGYDNNCNGSVNEGLDLGQPCGVNGTIICDGDGGTTCEEQ